MFVVTDNSTYKTSPGNYLLVEAEWDDWFTYDTLYILFYFDEEGVRKRIGPVKIGEFGMQKGQRRPNLPPEFETLDDKFFSVGQISDYYVELYDAVLHEEVLAALKDVTYDKAIFRKANNERVFTNSLMRSVRETSVLGEFSRIISGAAALTEYDFKYIGPQQLDKVHPPIKLEFHVTPESDPPSNIHVLIGRNGIGKSFLLNAMITALVTSGASTKTAGQFVDEDVLEPEPNIFRNVVSVSFSAFDKFEPIPQSKVTVPGVTYAYVGLKKMRQKQEKNIGIKNLVVLSREFSISAQNCLIPEKLSRWQRALDMLESDPIFKVAKISNLADIDDVDEFKLAARKRFRDLSSGHKIVLLTITRLVELVEERSLVLLDEPESHLHPPLLSAFLRALSDLLNNRNGVAIVATHSPVVLQEVPKSCTWLLERYHTLMKAERPNHETFAENVGILTHRIFGLEVEEAGFYNLLKDAVLKHDDYEKVIEQYEREIGSEGRGLIRSLIALQKKRDLS